MKIFISYPLTDNPSGGGNQFLRNLKREFLKLNISTDLAEEGDVILYNGHHNIENTARLKKRHPNKIFVHRMDGLQKLYNNHDDTRQDLAVNYNKLSSATIFQSNWARKEFAKAGFNPKKWTVIYNSSDNKIFNMSREKNENKKIELLCTSWSPNLKKGFEFYQKLDKSLDFNKFNFTFVGNKPKNIHYQNIKCLPPETTSEIGRRLKQTDIFISATENDCCSNSIIEALASNVPVIALNSGGNPELINRGGLLFQNLDDFAKKLSIMTQNIAHYKKHIKTKTTQETAMKYLDFFNEIS